MLKYHFLALLLGTVLDYFIGDPHKIPHPVVLIGNLISGLEAKLNKSKDLTSKQKQQRGQVLVIIVLVITFISSTLLIYLSYYLNVFCGLIVEMILSCYCLAFRSLVKESTAVTQAYEQEGIEAARKSLSMIVGRDTYNLDFKDVLKADVETIAENSSDGIIAPFIYLLLGGPSLGLTYKAINTMDSMLGYHNDKYEDFGKAAAIMDDIVNIIPSRVTAIIVILCSRLFGREYDYKEAKAVYKRDRYNHKSPNSAQSESAFAGALGLMLGGPSYYFGKLVEKPYIGNQKKTIETDDVKRANRLLTIMFVSCQLLCLILLLVSCL